MNETTQYDVTIIGGGLAGLALSIQLAAKKYSVALFEKEEYPFHRVCGEYISLESWDFIERLGLPLSTMQLPVIKKLIVSSPNGNVLKHHLPLGGFGISRYTIDFELKKIAEAAGVIVYEHCKVEDVIFANEQFELHTAKGNFTSMICAGSFGKRSNLDVKWKRNFILKKNNKLSNYIGVKYHIKTDFAADTIALHNFKDGYCGISKIEQDAYCLCYLTNAANLRDNDNSISELEKNVLYKNKHLKNIFETATMLFSAPVTISQISFAKKTQVQNHVLLCGDAAGIITPLCGNGMSMALHSSKVAAEAIADFLEHTITRPQMEAVYARNWQQLFGKRVFAGRLIQEGFGKMWITNLFISIMKRIPFITGWLIRQTHGEPF
ncbi:NAD(P)/FAD-dependent oxidoreductase [soil metagenome]